MRILYDNIFTYDILTEIYGNNIIVGKTNYETYIANDCVKILSLKKIDKGRINKFLCCAAKYDAIESFQYLLYCGADVYSYDQFCVKKGGDKIIKYILENYNISSDLKIKLGYM